MGDFSPACGHLFVKERESLVQQDLCDIKLSLYVPYLFTFFFCVPLLLLPPPSPQLENGFRRLIIGLVQRHPAIVGGCASSWVDIDL